MADNTNETQKNLQNCWRNVLTWPIHVPYLNTWAGQLRPRQQHKRRDKPMMTKPQTDIDYEVVNHGAEHSQYFSGCGTFGTDYDNCVTGYGNTYNEALADALEQACMVDDDIQADADVIESIERIADDQNERTSCCAEVERQALAEYPDAYKVVQYSRSMGRVFDGAETDDLDDCRIEVAKRLRTLRQNHVITHPLFNVDRSTGEVLYEICDREDAAMSSDMCGHIGIEFIDRSDERERMLENSELYYYVSIRF